MEPKDVLHNFRERDLRAVIREAYKEATTGETVSRAYRAKEVLEKAIARFDDE